jgi:hypothetical protein
VPPEVRSAAKDDEITEVKRVLITIALIALVACGGGSAPNGGSTRFLLLVHVPLAGSLSSASDATLLGLGRRACAELDQNTPSDQIVADIGGNPEPGSEAFNSYSFLVVAAAQQLCPAHRGEFSATIPTG